MRESGQIRNTICKKHALLRAQTTILLYFTKGTPGRSAVWKMNPETNPPLHGRPAATLHAMQPLVKCNACHRGVSGGYGAPSRTHQAAL